MKIIKNKILILIFIVILELSFNTVVCAKYVFQNEFNIANISIDRTRPKIELISISNNNKEYEKYASRNHTIILKIRITDKNLKNINVDKDYIKFMLDDNYINVDNVNFIQAEDSKNQKIYDIKITGIEGNGLLKIKFIKGTVIDEGNLENEELILDSKIYIDNESPTGTFAEEIIEQGKTKGVINISEQIKKIEGWNFLNDSKIEKEFTNNISYELPIEDFAGNKSIVNINITKATYIKLVYASHNSDIGWTYGYGNYDIAGKRAAQVSTVYKTEALAFNIEGNIDKDFVQARGYVYTHWGEGTYGRCGDTGLIYKYGYNPQDGSYKSMNSSDLVTLSGKRYFQFGGSRINSYQNTDINGNNPIPRDVSYIYPYGISGITMKLKDYSYFSIVYQILVDKVGWINACSDGKECMYSREKPMSAFRIALVPKTEKQYIIDTWNKDIGTYNLK